MCIYLQKIYNDDYYLQGKRTINQMVNLFKLSFLNPAALLLYKSQDSNDKNIYICVNTVNQKKKRYNV